MTPTEHLAQQVRRYRLARGWSQPQMGEECKKVGLHWDRSIIANVEAGRRTSLSVHELLALGRIFGVPPILLLFPLGKEPTIEILPGVTSDVWEAVKWFDGEDGFPGARTDDEYEWEFYAQPATTFRLHERLLGDHSGLLHRAREHRQQAKSTSRLDDGEDGDAADLIQTARRAEQGAAEIRGQIVILRQLMRNWGITPPALPDQPELANIDKPGISYPTGEGRFIALEPAREGGASK